MIPVKYMSLYTDIQVNRQTDSNIKWTQFWGNFTWWIKRKQKYEWKHKKIIYITKDSKRKKKKIRMRREMRGKNVREKNQKDLKKKIKCETKINKPINQSFNRLQERRQKPTKESYVSADPASFPPSFFILFSRFRSTSPVRSRKLSSSES